MNQVLDRKKLRREYLRKKGTAHIQEAIGGMLVIVASITCPVFVFMALSLEGWCLYGRWVWQSDMPGLTIESLKCIGISLISWAVCKYADRIAQKGHDRVAHIAYIPPVTPDTLPADEILVRGSEEPPVAQNDVLLRAATGQETPKEELLRVAQE